MLFGTFENSLNHRLIEPLFDFERVITDRLEYGFQLQYNNDRLFSDLWINWQNQIFPGDTTQEELEIGISVEYSFLKRGSWDFRAPLQLFAFHRGGQINITDERLQTLVNGAIGATAVYTFPNGSFFKELRFDNYFLFFFDNSGAT